jgi:hypothetical protein
MVVSFGIHRHPCLLFQFSVEQFDKQNKLRLERFSSLVLNIGRYLVSNHLVASPIGEEGTTFVDYHGEKR